MVKTRSSSSRAASLAPDAATPPKASSTASSASHSSPSPKPPARSDMASRSPSSRSPSSRSPSSRSPRGWAHTPTPATLFWMAVSLPLVVWDTGYVLGRPHTMEGGRLHWPLWAPYKLYGQVDHIYGWKALEARNGFTAAQGFLNLVETAMYLAYLCVYWRSADADPGTRPAAASPRNKALRGRAGAVAVLIGFSAAVMTLSKTVLYCEPAAPRLPSLQISLC